MLARLQKWSGLLRDAFWLVPAGMVVAGIGLALLLVWIDRADLLPQSLLASNWLYNGGGTGARTLLGAVASSTIGVAGTVFSITIAALSLAAGQMGPRLLRNFTRDRGNQVALGAFLATFSYALMVLRSVRTQEEGAFTPHLSMTVAILLAFFCVATLVYFVGHMASRINVDVVIDLVSEDVREAVKRLEPKDREQASVDCSAVFGPDALIVNDKRRGYLLHVDEEGLADWASERKTTIRLLLRPGEYLFPGVAIALASPPVDDVDDITRQSTSFGTQRGSSEDLEFIVRQLVEVAVRALSPGINDPHTAISVLDRLGTALCDLVEHALPRSTYDREGRCVLVIRTLSYDGLTDTMFHMIRQSAAGSAAVLIRILDVLANVVTVELDHDRQATLARHAALIMGDAERSIGSIGDLADVRMRCTRFHSALKSGRTDSD
ncbi:MAG: DUF2254 domain-containing protein, partial [Dokdonella sp.]|uniref:DUF2254 domain-containing protein n=1 Tax=Dokdonella sp. TaxID=2291710 RepID=UPI003266525A